MNALAPRAVQPAAPPNRIDQVSRALANQRDKLEAPFRALDRIYRLADSPDHLEGIDRAVADAMRAGLRLSDPFPRPGDFRALERSRELAASMPSGEELAEVRQMVLAGIETPPDASAARITLGLLLDAFPNAGREMKDGFFAALLHDVIDEGVSPHVLAETSRRIRREARFLPTIGEVLVQCASAKKGLEVGLTVVDRLIQMREACEACVDAFARPVDDWTREEWDAAARAAMQSQWKRDVAWPAHLGPEPGEPGCRMPADIVSLYGLGREAA